MADNFSEQLERVTMKSRMVVERYNAVCEEKSALESQIEELKASLLAQNAELDKLRLEIEYLRVATTLTPNSEEQQKVRDKISNLVREIDRCITDLIE
jgi:uncharacterized coiled-coil DUF342 family protein